MGSNIFEAARRSSHLDENLFARLLDMDHARLQALELGQAEPSPAEVDRCAQLFGIRVRELLAGGIAKAPMTLLLKSAYEGGRPSLDELDATGAQRILGEFLRAVRDAAELEDLLSRSRPELPRPIVSPPPPGVHPAERQARWLRTSLGLGLDPVPSLRALLLDLGVRLFFTTPDELDPAIDGASTRVPRPAILVNLLGGGSCWWRTRMTMAHEFAHLLFDADAGDVLFSPHRRFLRRPPPGWRWRLFEGFDDIEIHADAFAACFLAPAEGVRQCVGSVPPSSEVAIGAVGARFGVGRTVAINRLQHVFNLAREVRAEMEARPPSRYDANFPGDRVEAGVGIRRGDLVEMVGEALRSGKIGKVRAWEYLGVPLSESLPVLGLPESLRSPPAEREGWIRAMAQRHLAAAYPDRLLHSTRVRRGDGVWHVDIAEGGVGESALVDVGTLILDEQGLLVKDEAVRAAGPAE